MTASLAPMIRFQPLVAGVPIPGGKVYFYAAGTTTPQAAYADDGTTPLANPLTLDANGATDFRLGTGLSYKIGLTLADGTPVAGWPRDGIVGTDWVMSQTLGKLADTSDAANGDALVGVKSTLNNGSVRTAHDKFGEIVTATDFTGATDLAKFQNALAAIKTAGGKGTIIIPASMSTSWNVTDLGLSAGQAIMVIDQRAAKAAHGFGADTVWIEARDTGGGYASERRVVGKQNPGFVAETMSDGTATGYTKRNKASSFVHIGPRDRTITAASNTTPITITTSTPHQISQGGGWRVDISGVGGNTAANGSWVATYVNSTQFTLDNSVGNGAYTSGGTASVYGSNLWQTFSDPLFQGYDDWALYQYANGGSGAFAMHVGVDSSSQARFDLTPIRLLAPYSLITNATNATPIQVTTLQPHGLVSGTQVTISGVGGNTAANATWTITVVDPSNFTLNTSVGNGAYTSGGKAVPTISVTAATNASPIQITTAVPHGIAGNNAPVSITGVLGNTAANGNFLVTVINSTTFTLNGTTGSGTYTSGGTVTVQANSMRATLNVPSITGDGKSEAILAEGQVASVVPQGTAPVTTQSMTVDTNLHARPYIVNAAGVQFASGTPGSGGAKVVIGNTVMAGGTATVTLTNDAVFTSASTYRVTATDITGANAVKVARVSGSSFTITGTGTDAVDWMAMGW